MDISKCVRHILTLSHPQIFRFYVKFLYITLKCTEQNNILIAIMSHYWEIKAINLKNYTSYNLKSYRPMCII